MFCLFVILGSLNRDLIVSNNVPVNAAILSEVQKRGKKGVNYCISRV